MLKGCFRIPASPPRGFQKKKENKLKDFDKREVSLLRKELEILRPGTMFALGRTAEKALERIGFDAVYLRHPAWYVRRGLRSEEMQEEYREKLKYYQMSNILGE